MSGRAIADYFRDRGCLPYQTDFAVRFLDPSSPPHHILAMPPGSGKSRLASEIVGYLVTTNGARRVLVLTPPAVIEQFRTLIAAGTGAEHPQAVTRRVLRELEAAVPVGEPPWPVRFVGLMSPDLARQRDVSDLLLSVRWDLVVIDEAHHFSSPLKRELLKRLAESGCAARLLVLSDGPLDESVTAQIPAPVTTELTLRDLMGMDGTSLPPIIFEQRQYAPEPDESALLEALRVAEVEFARATGSPRFGRTLLDRARSSIFSLEQTLLELESRLSPASATGGVTTHTSPPTESTTSDKLVEDEGTGSVVDERVHVPNPATALAIVRHLLDCVDRVETDRKFQVLLEAIRRPDAEGERPRWVCVTTRYADTGRYLSTSLRDAGHTTYLVTGELSAGEREAAWCEFRRGGGVFILTPSVAESFSLTAVTLLVHYDPPRSPQEAGMWLGRLQRIGRTAPCSIVSLEGPDSDDGFRAYSSATDQV